MNNYKEWNPLIKYGLPIVLAMLGLFWSVYIHFNPNTQTSLNTDWINIESIFSKMNNLDTSLEKTTFVQKYENSNVVGEGIFLDVYGRSDEYYRAQLNVSGNPISCSFELAADIEQRLLVLKRGENITFSGKFKNTNDFGIGWGVDGCRLLETHSSNYFIRLYRLVKSRLQGF
jgi:hypothetical protein